MRWSIRNQILIPLLGIQAVAVTAATVTMATLAVRRSEREIISRLNDVGDTLSHGNFPYTESVLNRMRGLSGAHFVVATEGGKVLHTSLPAFEVLPASLRDLPREGASSRCSKRRQSQSVVRVISRCPFSRRLGRVATRCSSSTHGRACSRCGGKR